MRKIESVDFFYLSMPVVTTEGDGSQDALLVRVTAGDLVGWGECQTALCQTLPEGRICRGDCWEYRSFWYCLVLFNELVALTAAFLNRAIMLQVEQLFNQNLNFSFLIAVAQGPNQVIKGALV